MKPESPSQKQCACGDRDCPVCYPVGQKQEGEEPEFYKVGNSHELCRFPSGPWSLRYGSDGEHIRYLGEHEVNLIEGVRIALREQLDAAVRENERLRLPPNETLSEYPGCGYCMEAGTPVRPGQVCPRCNDRLPTLNEYWLRRLTGELAKLFPSLGNPVLLEYCPEDKWDETISKLRLAAESELEAVRKRTIEECARVCEGRAGSGPYAESMGAFRVLISAADAIRSLPLTGSGEK